MSRFIVPQYSTCRDRVKLFEQCSNSAARTVLEQFLTSRAPVLYCGTMDWFTVDKTGLAKLLDKRGKSFALFELIQNAWDTDATCVDVSIEPIAGRPLATVRVEDDDPEGFRTLTHAFTLFAESEKKADPTKRGRFNLGEKLVLALCETASISSTRGTVIFDGAGRRESRKRRERGSVFEGVMRMTRAELEEAEVAVQRLLPPLCSTTSINGVRLRRRGPCRSFEAVLPTEASDAEGFLRRSQRRAAVTVHTVLLDEKPTLYEMGIPVVELSGGEPWHVNVHQKIPLNVDRDNVTPAYLQTVRVLLANEMREHLRREDVDRIWLNAATEDERIEPAVVAKVLDGRFGDKRAIFDPSDHEANKQLLNEGYAIIPGGALSKGQWENVKSANLATPAGQIRPSGVRYNPDGRLERIIPPDKYTDGQKRVVDFAERLAIPLIAQSIRVKLVNEPVALPHAAWYGGGVLAFNVGRLGKAWFEGPLTPAHLELILHELAHERVKDHLTREFADEVARLAVKALAVALREPAFFEGYTP